MLNDHKEKLLGSEDMKRHCLSQDHEGIVNKRYYNIK